MPALIWVLPLHLRNHSEQAGVLEPHPLVLPQPRTLFLHCTPQEPESLNLRESETCYKGDQEPCWKGAGAIKSKTEECSDLWGQKPPGWAPTWIILALQQLLQQNHCWLSKEPCLSKDDTIGLIFSSASHSALLPPQEIFLMPRGREISSAFPSGIQPKSTRSSEMRNQFAAKIFAFETRNPISKVAIWTSHF